MGCRRRDDGAAGRATAQPADIAILFRALSDVAIYEEALRDHGLDYYLVGGHAFYAQQEIFDVLNLLRTIHSPSDLVSLAGVLRSGMFSLADETIFWLAGHPEGLSAGLFAPQPPPSFRPRKPSALASRPARFPSCASSRTGCGSAS